MQTIDEIRKLEERMRVAELDMYGLVRRPGLVRYNEIPACVVL